jgi:hypothetical protein
VQGCLIQGDQLAERDWQAQRSQVELPVSDQRFGGRRHDRLIRELDSTVNPEDKGALNVAIRSLMSAIDIQETLTRFEQSKPQKQTGRDMETYEERHKYLKTIMDPSERRMKGNAVNLVSPGVSISRLYHPWLKRAGYAGAKPRLSRSSAALNRMRRNGARSVSVPRISIAKRQITLSWIIGTELGT